MHEIPGRSLRSAVMQAQRTMLMPALKPGIAAQWGRYPAKMTTKLSIYLAAPHGFDPDIIQSYGN